MKTQHFLVAFILSLGAFSTASPVFAQVQPTTPPSTTTPPPATTPAAPPPTTAPADEQEGLFRKGEWTLSPFAAYVDQAGGKWAGGLAATYFLEKHLGIGGASVASPRSRQFAMSGTQSPLFLRMRLGNG